MILPVLALSILTIGVQAQDDLQKKANALGTTLGASVGGERSVAGGRVREFERGAIFWSRKTGARFVGSGALAKYNELGGASGSLGFPVSDERASGESLSQTFEHGFITIAESGEPVATIVPGVTFTEDSLTVISPNLITLAPLLGSESDLVLAQQTGPDVTVSCSCAQSPSNTSQRLGLCTVKISKSRKTATCTSFSCNGSCGFSSGTSER